MFRLNQLVIKHLWVAVCCLLCWLSCQKENDPPPTPLIPIEKMAMIQVDVHLAEASIMTYRSFERDSMAQLFYQHIFRIHQTTEEEYYPSLEYYSQHPIMMKNIYEITNEKLKEMEEQQDKKKRQ